ncbi:MAG: VWA domain-containing protein [Planctomycetes bacterium]|nr:VWA domain-containing protein [Planctomycetota bacterium]
MSERALTIAAILVSCAAPALAQGILVPQTAAGTPAETALPPFVVEYHRAEVELSRQIATVKVDMVFRNPGSVPAEGIFVLPVPRGTAVQDFTLRAGDKVLEAKLLPADEARRLYESIVNQRKDPGLLEFVGQSCLQARVFPIPPGGEQSFTVSYASLATREDDVVRWAYPVRSLRHAAPAAGKVSIKVTIREDEPIRSIFSPTHDVLVVRSGEREAEVEYAPDQAYVDEDFLLYYGLSGSDVGVTVLSHQAGEDDAYFAVLAAPRVEGLEPAPKDVVFVIDTSGSMRGDKWTQAEAAIGQCLARLAPQDRFGIVAFSTDVRVFASELVPATKEKIEEAAGFVSAQRVNGGTAIHEATRKGFELAAQVGSSREPFVILLTDGLPTIGERDPAAIQKSLAGANAARARLFVFGVGYDVDAQLLDRLAADHAGWSDYVHPGEPLDLRVTSFFRKVESPVLTDLVLEIDGVRAQDVYPKELPPLFAGGQLVLFGQALGQGKATFRLRGKVRGEERVYEVEHEFRANRTDHAFLPILWATRKIGYLLDQIRMHGKSEELVDEIVRLSKKYGVITEYTSFFVEEAGIAHATDLRLQLEENLARAYEQRAGNWACNQGLNLRNYRDITNSSQVNLLFGQAGANQVREAGVRRMGEKVFYLRGDTWVDSAYDGKIELNEVESFTEDYWKLNAGDADMAQYQSLGRKVIIVQEGKALYCR